MTSTAKKVLLWFSALFSSVPIRRPGQGFTCRVCFQELRGDAFKTECSCKGDLAIGHKKCIRKWFVLKGNNICDVCKVEVKNLAITPGAASDGFLPRIWKSSLLFFASTLSYFCFLENTLVRDTGIARPLVFSLPIAICIAILLCVMASSRGNTRYTWAHALSYVSVVVPFLYTYRDANASLLFIYILSGLMLEILTWNSMRRSRALLRRLESI
ncbi:unnamed protein product [Cuscuta campestris]|uniref:RING-CH-type domain-containing protein n=1 Tax=Cuscuta campestris TaxID=132261 RepID=A0A484LIU2_9ASTE|nr:unnamed protein product [Cuscuta campestris]